MKIGLCICTGLVEPYSIMQEFREQRPASPFLLLYSASEVWWRDVKEWYKANPFTINDKKEIEMLIESGVDGIITDYPDRALEVKAKLNSRKRV